MGSHARTTRLGLGASLLVALLVAAPAAANEIAGQRAASGLRVHGPEEVLRDFCSVEDDGSVWFKVPGGSTWELITSTTDPAIANPGDGAFHPYAAAEVAAALAQVRFAVDQLDVDVYLLPYPRRGALDSGAGPALILLSPGVMPIAPARQHAEFVHELGHVVQYQWMPDGDARWSEYRRRRGIEDATTYSASASHANRPHEIFAEDFRALFGGSLATYSGSIENPSLAYPAEVPGLDAFFRALPEGAAAVTRLAAGANPARGPVTFAIAGATTQPLDLFDVTGRRLATIAPSFSGAQTTWNWDGRGSDGRHAPRGMVLARVRGAAGAATRITWLP